MLNEFELEKEYFVQGILLYIDQEMHKVKYKGTKQIVFAKKEVLAEEFSFGDRSLLFLHIPSVVEDEVRNYYWQLQEKVGIYLPQANIVYQFQSAQNIEISEERKAYILGKMKEVKQEHKKDPDEYLGLDILYELVDEIPFFEKEFLLDNQTVEELGATLICGMLTITLPIRGSSSARERWAVRAREHLTKTRPNEVDGIMMGLE